MIGTQVNTPYVSITAPGMGVEDIATTKSASLQVKPTILAQDWVMAMDMWGNKKMESLY